MKKILFYVIIFTFSLTLMSFATDNQGVTTKLTSEKSQVIDSEVISKLNNTFKLEIVEPDFTPTQLVKWLLATLGTFLTGLILSLLNKWFPNIFKEKNHRKY